MSRERDVKLPPSRKDTTVVAEHSAIVVIKFTNFRDFNQNKRSKSQYPEAPNAEANARTTNVSIVFDCPCIGDCPNTFRTGINSQGEKTATTLKTPTSEMKIMTFPGVATVRSRREITNELA